jgi:hypothetical protein
MYSLRLGKICRFLLMGLLAAAAPRAGSAKPSIVPTGKSSSESSIPLICPKRNGVCLWTEKAGWRKILATTPDEIVEFSQSNAGQLMILVRGHGDPGQTIVAGRDGRIRVVRNNAVEGNLARVTGSDSRGDVVLCSDTPEDARCDTFIPRQERYTAAPWFPAGCLFPRFLSDGSRACLASLPQPTLLFVKGNNEVQKVALPAELSNPTDFLSLSPSQFIFLVDNALYSFTLGAGLEVIARDGALWTTQIGGAILFASYQEHDGVSSVRRYTPGTGIEKIWTSTKFVPAMVQPGRNGLFLDVWGGGSRQIVYLPSKAGGKEKIIWREESSALWK